jgi:hypothetical protein
MTQHPALAAAQTPAFARFTSETYADATPWSRRIVFRPADGQMQETALLGGMDASGNGTVR